MSAREKIEALVEQLPQQLDADIGFEFVYEFHRLRSALNRLSKQAWLLEVDNWLRDEAPDGLRFKVNYDKPDGYYLAEDSIDGIEDDEEINQEIEGLLDALGQLEPNDSSWCEMVVSELNQARWCGAKAREVLAKRAEGMGIENGRAWMDGVAAEQQRRKLEADTPDTAPAKPRGSRL